MEVMHNSNPQSFVCDMCGKKFSVASYLKRHQARVHKEPRPTTTKTTECKLCNKSYRRIERHYRESHSGEGATYMCDLCGQKFRQSFELKLHMMRHSGEKPNKCTYEGCMKSFVRKQHLLLHMRSHTGEKPFECTICGNRYTQKPSLVVHMRGHVGEKPYQCDLCWSKFASKQRLNIHKRKVHKLVIVLAKKKLDS
ncbi:hypothetical protein D910_07708 [Dendroctonus ponderosae]|uniref:C2H2-type domain-containing protein n=1 Tax=Dendroctonus ponderosae TaxID=77166 RepID=U4U8Z2_DENPD|nr:hypothetical protein D910_07708 [Dendroctonus ponderosae]KAH1010278.1 hypothetical protein HUJ05_004596 [Dendroctonus ponderosae]